MSSSNPTHFWMPAIQNKISSNGDQTNYLRGMGNGAISGLDWISLGEQQDSNLQFDFTEFFRFLLCVKQNQPARCACCSRRQGLTYRVGFSQMEISWLILPRGRGDSTIAPLWSPSLATSADTKVFLPACQAGRGEKSEAVELLPHRANYLSSGVGGGAESKVQL